jgi:cytochrome c
VRVISVLALLSLSTGAASAQGDPEAGRALALQWCTSCHIVDLEGHGTDAAPPLPALLGEGLRTPDQLRGWLAAPHPPMPDFALTRQEIEDIVAYLEDLAGLRPRGAAAGYYNPGYSGN